MIIYGLLGMEKKANKTKAFIIIFTCSEQLPFPEHLQHGGTGSETQSHVSHKISKLKKHIQLDFWGGNCVSNATEFWCQPSGVQMSVILLD